MQDIDAEWQEMGVMKDSKKKKKRALVIFLLDTCFESAGAAGARYTSTLLQRLRLCPALLKYLLIKSYRNCSLGPTACKDHVFKFQLKSSIRLR